MDDNRNNLKQLVLSASGVLVEREFSRIIRELKEMGPQADYDGHGNRLVSC